MRLTVIFQLKLTKTNPAPPIFHAFNVEGYGNAALKQSYLKGKNEMLRQYPGHKFIQRLAVVSDLSALLMVNGIEEEVLKDEHGDLAV